MTGSLPISLLLLLFTLSRKTEIIECIDSSFKEGYSEIIWNFEAHTLRKKWSYGGYSERTFHL